MTHTSPPDGHEGPLAEFAALRQEIESRETRRQNLFNLHITASGAVFGFVLAGGRSSLLLLILPITTYLFCARFAMHSYGVFKIGRYIRDDLTHRVPGGLQWEEWQEKQAVPLRIPRLVYPNFIAFPALALAALIWTAPTVFVGWPQALIAARIGALTAWTIGVVATFFCVLLINSTARRWYEENAGSSVRPQAGPTDSAP
ncbi:hypothetical protein OIE67_38750 [Nonomuraea fuscirosea]|uniref:hypothetical protein n=1 Tax=Nonomuraea fuscirosea TaxID=1291556 RepID=UPI002DDBF829|nr:hypothetical protein [Nonomuraea fuscirosea]WSA49965.1 hypothetical protein OIE67_38750 [Nonomuraea fuscirosea]